MPDNKRPADQQRQQRAALLATVYAIVLGDGWGRQADADQPDRSTAPDGQQGSDGPSGGTNA